MNKSARVIPSVAFHSVIDLLSLYFFSVQGVCVLPKTDEKLHRRIDIR